MDGVKQTRLALPEVGAVCAYDEHSVVKTTGRGVLLVQAASEAAAGTHGDDTGNPRQSDPCAVHHDGAVLALVDADVLHGDAFTTSTALSRGPGRKQFACEHQVAVVNADWLGPGWAAALGTPCSPGGAAAAAGCLRGLVPPGAALCTEVHPTGCTLVPESALRQLAADPDGFVDSAGSEASSEASTAGSEDVSELVEPIGHSWAHAFDAWTATTLTNLVHLMPELAPVRHTPPKVLYHGTKPSALHSIQTRGFQPSTCTKQRQCLVRACVRVCVRARFHAPVVVCVD